MNHLLKVTLVLVLSLNIHAANKCIKSEVLSLNDTVVGNIEHRIVGIKNVLSGKGGDSSLIWNVFGNDFDFNRSDEYISKLETINSKSRGISEEYEYLSNCLKELKLTKRMDQLEKLSIEYNNFKVQLFKKNKALNNSIKLSIDSNSSIPSLAKEIDEEFIVLEKSKRDIEKELAQNESKTLIDSNSKEVVFYQNSLLKFKLDLIKTRILFNRNLQQKIEYFNLKSLKLSNLSSNYEERDTETIEAQFVEVEKIWKEVTKQNFYDLIKGSLFFDIPRVPGVFTSKRNVESEIRATLETERSKVSTFRKESISDLTKKKEEELKLLNNLLIQINSLRSNYYNKLSFSFLSGRFFTSSYLSSLKNEIYASPYRLLNYVYSKYLFVNEKLSLGRDGITDLSLLLFKYMMIILGVFSFKLVLHKIYDFLEKKNRGLVSKRKRSEFFSYLTTIWNKHSDNFYSISWLFLLFVLSHFELLNNISIILNIFIILIVAKIIRSLVILFLSTVSSIDSRNYRSFKLKAEGTAGRFANIYLVYSLIMVLLNLTVGKVYIYSIVKFVAIIYSLYQVIETSSVWSKEFSTYTEKKFSGVIVDKIERFYKFLPSKIQGIFSFLFISILTIVNIFIRMTEDFAISKKISANLFRKQVESVEVEEGASEQIPNEYKEKFTFNSLDVEEHYVNHTSEIEESICNEIVEWIDEKSEEHSVVVYGDKGIGKTTLLKKVIRDMEGRYTDELSCVYTKVPAKTIDREKAHTFIVNALGLEENGSFDLYKLDKMLEKKTVLVIDEAQNLFLSHTKGFSAYNGLLNMINLSTENIFWVLSFNKYSWLYLDRAFGRSQFFRNIFPLKGWDDTAIKELIFKRHLSSEYKLSYDLLINATRSQDEMDRYTTVESKFFKLLWELSRGNPRAALYLWLTSLSRRNSKTFNVHIPKDADLDSLDKLADDIFFVIASVLKHENLSPNEIESTTNLPKGIVRNAIKVGQERNFFFKDKHGRYMIEISSQYGLIKYLKSKNFIYGY
ncbi:AAA family ATPase [Halobacteriovorax marinus]|uniref:AAA family ATPase n=1 Tax=Halobacteriovorax marinus TaxID=97084 RepID=UPI003A8E12E6